MALRRVPRKPTQLGWSDERIDTVFKYHNPMKIEDSLVRSATIEGYESMRAAGGELARKMARYCPESPELTRAINHIQEAIMLANAAIAVNGVNLPRIAFEDAREAAIAALEFHCAPLFACMGRREIEMIVTQDGEETKIVDPRSRGMPAYDAALSAIQAVQKVLQDTNLWGVVLKRNGNDKTLELLYESPDEHVTSLTI